MGKRAPQMPPTPDPVAAATAQGAANREAAIAAAELSMVNQRTPFGELVYSPIGDTAKGTPRYQAITALSPSQQQILNAQQGVSLGLTDLAGAQLGRIGTNVSSPFTYAGMPQAPTTLTPTVDPISGISTLGVRRTVDRSGLPALMDTGQLGAERARIEASMFNRLNPQLQRDRDVLLTRLANQGIIDPSSQAYMGSIDELNRKENDLRLGIIGASGDEMARLFNISAAGRGQLFGEGTTDAGFANAAEAQQFGQGIGQANLANAARAQQINEQAAMGDFTNAARARAIQEEAFRRGLPLQELAAFLGTGGGPQLPQFVNTGQRQIVPGNIEGNIYSGFQGDLLGHQAKMAGQAADMGALAGLGGAALMSGAYYLR